MCVPLLLTQLRVGGFGGFLRGLCLLQFLGNSIDGSGLYGVEIVGVNLFGDAGGGMSHRGGNLLHRGTGVVGDGGVGVAQTVESDVLELVLPKMLLEHIGKIVGFDGATVVHHGHIDLGRNWLTRIAVDKLSGLFLDENLI